MDGHVNMTLNSFYFRINNYIYLILNACLFTQKVFTLPSEINVFAQHIKNLKKKKTSYSIYRAIMHFLYMFTRQAELEEHQIINPRTADLGL
jgi:hypothetical protein